MNLKTQFMLGTLIALIALFSLLFVGVGIRLQHYFQTQLSAHAQDTATSLAVAINAALREKDTLLLETTVQAVFDSGYYKHVSVRDTSGFKIIEKELPSTNGNVPSWLPQFITLNPPLRTALVTSGWKQAGTVEVSSQPSFAYQELWLLMKDATIWLALAIIFTMLLMTLLVRSILRPLVNIEKAALAITRRNFMTISPLPNTRELKRVVQAFNALSSAVRTMLSEAENLAERFRKQTLTDALTGIGNRRGLTAHIEMMLESSQTEFILALIQVDGLAELNNKTNHKQGDEFVMALVHVLIGIPKISYLARVQGSTFALLLEFNTDKELSEILDSSCQKLKKICNNFELTDAYGCSAGAVKLINTQNSSEALAKADEALAKAKKTGHSEVDVNQSLGIPSAQWKHDLQAALTGNRFQLYAQPVIRYTAEPNQADAELLHVEIYTRLAGIDGKLIKAARFIPMAIRHHLAANIDQHSIINLIKFITQEQIAGKKYAFNISQETLLDAAFPAWLSNQLTHSAISKSDLILEISESILRTSPQDGISFSEAMNNHGLSFGIDQFGLHKGTVTDLAKLQPAYFKLATELTRNATDIDEYGEYIAWLTKTAKMLGISVIATCVQEKEWLERLFKTGVTGFQGQLIGPVASLERPEEIELIVS
jgi:diguanylate cyclase (GGDEF)-like protein